MSSGFSRRQGTPTSRQNRAWAEPLGFTPFCLVEVKASEAWEQVSNQHFRRGCGQGLPTPQSTGLEVLGG